MENSGRRNVRTFASSLRYSEALLRSLHPSAGNAECNPSLVVLWTTPRNGGRGQLINGSDFGNKISVDIIPAPILALV
jgi:hypothetical protein